MIRHLTRRIALGIDIKTILVIAGDLNDEDLGCGSAIAKLSGEHGTHFNPY